VLASFALLPYVLTLFVVMRFQRQWGQDLPSIASEEQQLRLRQKRRTAVYDLIGFLGAFLVIIAGGAFLLSNLRLLRPCPNCSASFESTVAVLLICLISVLLGLLLHRLLAATRLNLRNLPERAPIYRFAYVGTGLFLILLMVAAYAAAFMALLYPQIPEQFGGGRPVEVRLLIRQDSLDGVRQLGLPIATSAGVTEVVPLLYEGSDSYVVRISGRRIRLNRDLIQGVVIAD
jgi:hypothetical protein